VKNGINNVASTQIVAVFDMGVWIGGISCGLFSDQFMERRRVLYMLPSGLMAVCIIGIYLSLTDVTPIIYGVVSFFYGLFLGAPYQVLNGSIGIDLSKQP